MSGNIGRGQQGGERSLLFCSPNLEKNISGGSPGPWREAAPPRGTADVLGAGWSGTTDTSEMDGVPGEHF